MSHDVSNGVNAVKDLPSADTAKDLQVSDDNVFEDTKAGVAAAGCKEQDEAGW